MLETDIDGNAEFRRNDWSLQDVSDFSPSTKEQVRQIIAYSDSPLLQGGKMEVTFSKSGTLIAFDTNEGDNILNMLQTRKANKSKSSTEEGEIVTFYEDEISVVIGKRQDGTTKQRVEIRIDKYQSVSVALRHTLGLGDLLLLQAAPTPLTSEYAEKLVIDGEVSMGRRTIPIKIAADSKDIRHMEPPLPKDGCRVVYHGTSLTTALQIAEEGFRSVLYVRPTLSEIPYGTSLTLARNEWEGYQRADSSGYGAIIVLQVPNDKLQDRGEMFSPAGGVEHIFQTIHIPASGDRIEELRMAQIVIGTMGI